MLCKDCPRGKKEIIPGSGLGEPPYVEMVRCPFDDKYYHDPDAECNFTEAALLHDKAEELCGGPLHY